VVITVTTVKYAPGPKSPTRKIEVLREATERGQFDEAIRVALDERLEPWALQQALTRLLAKRPSVGHPVAYEGWFSDRRQLLVSCCPASQPGSAPVGRPRILKGLYLPSREELEALAHAA
jgi:hypothetical protein